MALCKVCGNTLDESGKCICGADQTANDNQVNGQPSTQMPEQQNWSQSDQQYQPQPNQQYQPQPNQQYQPKPNQQYQPQPNQQYQPQPNQQYQPQPNQQAYQQPVQKSQFGVELSKVLKGFFSISPTDSLTHATKSSSPLFALFGGIYCLLYAFSSMPTSSYYSQYYGYSSYSYVSYFFWGLVLGAIVFFVNAGLIKLIHVIYKQNVNFTKVMNMVSVALIPASIGMLAGTIFDFVFPTIYIGSWILSAGTLMGTLMIYIGMQKEAKFKHSPIWLYTALYLVLIIAKYIYTYITGLIGF